MGFGVTIVENSIFGAYTGEWKVHWALVMMNMVKQLVTKIGKSKPTSIRPYVLYVYYVHDIILPEDKKAYMVGESIMRHNIEPDEEEQPAGTKDLDRKSLSLGEIVELHAQQKKKLFLPNCKQIPSGKWKEKSPQKEEEPTIPKKEKCGPFHIIMDALQDIQNDFSYTQKIV